MKRTWEVAKQILRFARDDRGILCPSGTSWWREEWMTVWRGERHLLLGTKAPHLFAGLGFGISSLSP